MQNKIIGYVTRLQNRVVRDTYLLSIRVFELTIFTNIELRTIYFAPTFLTEYLLSLASLEQHSKTIHPKYS